MIIRTPGWRPLHVETNGDLWLGRGLSLYRSQPDDNVPVLLGSIPIGFFKGFSNRFRPVSRVIRGGIHSLLPITDKLALAVVRGAIYKWEDGSDILRPVFSVPRGSRPLNLCRLASGLICFGEYFGNSDRQDVHVYASEDDGESWNVAYVFDAGTIRHVHGVFFDCFRNGCWVLTGDADSESRVLFTSDEFRTLDKVFAGSQKFRLVCLVPQKDGLITGTDTPLERNYIQRLLPDTGRIERLQEVPGSVFDAAVVGHRLAITTTVEPSTVNLCNHTTLWLSEDGDHWEKVFERKRDWFQPVGPLARSRLRAVFQHGRIVLPSGENHADVLYAYGQAIRGYDDCLIEFDVSRHRPPG